MEKEEKRNVAIRTSFTSGMEENFFSFSNVDNNGVFDKHTTSFELQQELSHGTFKKLKCD